MKPQPETFPWIWFSLCLVPSGHAYPKPITLSVMISLISLISGCNNEPALLLSQQKKTFPAFPAGSTPARRVRNLRQTLLEVRRNTVLTVIGKKKKKHVF